MTVIRVFLQFYSGSNHQLHSRILWTQRLNYVRSTTCFVHVQPISQSLMQSSKCYSMSNQVFTFSLSLSL